MAWDGKARRVAAKVIGTVESGFKYDAINYRDPITVGAFQWFGTRAAAILLRMKKENAGSWRGVAASLDRDLSTHSASSSWWTSRNLTRAEGDSLRGPLLGNVKIQQSQMFEDLEGYKLAYQRNGGDAERNTQAFCFFACMWHQAPARSLEVLRAAGPGASLARLHSVCLNNRVLSRYKTRYNTAKRMIEAWDDSGFDGAVPEPSPPPPGDDEPEDDKPLASAQGRIIRRVGKDLQIVTATGGVIYCPAVGSDTWAMPGALDGENPPPIVEDPPVPKPPDQPPAPNPPGVPPGGDGYAQKALQWMLRYVGKWRYSQASGRLNPLVSGYTDCSGLMWSAWKAVGGPDIGGFTTPQSKKGTLITTDKNRIRAGVGMVPGDLIFYRSRATYPSRPYGHVEMYMGNGKTIGIAPSTSPGPAIRDIRYHLDSSTGNLGAMARRV